MKFSSTKNKGYGRTLKFAFRNILEDKFGKGSNGTRRAHLARLKRFAAFLHASGVKDLRQIDQEHLLDYGTYVGELCDSGELSISYGNNLISSTNVLLDLLTNGASRGVSPSALVGRRSYVRTEAPSGLAIEEYTAAIDGLLSDAKDRLALMIGICRLTGARFREASLLCLADARRQANRHGEIVITEGSKGGRAKRIPRHVAASDQLIELLNTVVPRIEDRTVIPTGENYIRWYSRAHREWRRLSANFAMNGKFHDLRASYACQRLEELTGTPAPCLNGQGVSFNALPECERLSDAEARRVVAEELGHRRIDVVAAYCGSPK